MINLNAYGGVLLELFCGTMGVVFRQNAVHGVQPIVMMDSANRTVQFFWEMLIYQMFVIKIL